MPFPQFYKEEVMRYLIALDAGTTSVRAFLYDIAAREFVYRAQQELGLSFPRPGWVEQDAEEIYCKAAYVLRDCLRAADGDVAGIGIANQRETTVLWDRETGEPVCPAIGWQCRRTGEWCAALDEGVRRLVGERTGLVPDAYFSAGKIRWDLDHVPAARRLMKAGRLCAGTVDSWLVFRFTEGRSFVTDVTNASRTMLFNIHTLDWDKDLLERFSIPRAILPEVRDNDALFGEVRMRDGVFPIAGMAGDQQAALIGQGCFAAGEGKITYGTGLFVLFSSGETPVRSQSGLLTAVGYRMGGRSSYALEGSAFHAGSAVRWLRDGLGLLSAAAESETLAASVEDSGGVRFVPAFTGLGAPHWQPQARALFSGVTLGTTRAHLVRAVLESIAFEARELVDCVRRDGVPVRAVRCDGGASANGLLMQFQADLLGVTVDRPHEKESTALGAAMLCALALGMTDEASLPSYRRAGTLFQPDPVLRGTREADYRDYLLAVRRALLVS